MTDLNKLVANCKKLVKPGVFHESIYEDDKYRIYHTKHDDGYEEITIFKYREKINVEQREVSPMWHRIFKVVQNEDMDDFLKYLERVLDERDK